MTAFSIGQLIMRLLILAILLPSTISRSAPSVLQTLKYCDASGPRVSALSLNSALNTFLCYTEEEVGAMEEVEKKLKLAQRIAPFFHYEDIVGKVLKMPLESLIKIVNIVMNSKYVQTDLKTIEEYHFVINELLDTNVESDLDNPQILALMNNNMEDLGRNGRVAHLGNFLKWIKLQSVIEGGWSDFSDWSLCNETCGTGIKEKTRTCSNPPPQNGGQQCQGVSKETKNCVLVKDCPIDGGLSDYSDWGFCSEPCGNGTKIRSRTCTQPQPQFGGDDCTGVYEETQNCFLIENCPIHGGWTTHSDWSVCSQTCGQGKKVRSRTCSNPSPSFGGDDCGGESEEVQMCAEVENCQLTSGCASPDNVNCQPTGKYRRMDGMCNNLQETDKGAAGTSFSRFIMNAYEDGLFIPRGGFNPSSLPNPRFVSMNLHRGDNVLSSKGVTHMTMQFGQFLAHDLTHASQEKLDCCNIPDLNSPAQKRCFNIDVNSDPFYNINGVSCRPFTRSDFCHSTKSKVRDQINGVTAFIDASQVYGSSDETAKKLRTLTDGLLKINSDKASPSLPTRQQCGFSTMENQQPSDLVAGGTRVLETPTLAAMHTLFMNEHNRIAKELKSKLTGFLKGKTVVQKDDFLFQESRKILISEIQNIVYNEYLPVILGEEKILSNQLKLQAISLYDQTIDPSIRNEFATVAFRFGHTQISGTFKPSGPGASPWSLRQNFFKFEDLVLNQDGNGWKNEMRGAIRQTCPAADLHFTQDVTNFLFANSSAHLETSSLFGQDLVALNIQRGRDHGIPSYNKLRSICGLPKLESYLMLPAEISTENWNKLRTVYINVDDIDGYTGGLSETTISDGLVGPTFACIIAKQFNHLLYGDRFFFTHTSESPHVKGLKSESKATVLGRTLGDILCDNADISETQANVFKEASATNTKLSCSSRKGLNFKDIASEISS